MCNNIMIFQKKNSQLIIVMKNIVQKVLLKFQSRSMFKVQSENYLQFHQKASSFVYFRIH